MSIDNPIRTLTAEVARKIAAGEVIDRPNAIVRELIDNAIDSGAKNITVEIAGGGIDKIRVVDDGCGMTKEDLATCAHPHATSKISTETDLLNLSTLGFRGEALSSIAAVSRLSIISSGYKMRASITEDHIIEETAQTKGTIVQSEGLFENFPARRQFLKRAGTEALMCKNTFIEKAMARPDISFRFINDGEVKLNLPACESFKERFINANNYPEDKALFFELSGKSSGTDNEWSFTAIIGEPAVSRSNKKDINIYTNGRKIQEYSLVQAVEYGGMGFFPNGTYPVACVFVEINPKLVDFNIHPAKREARFYDISDLHHGVSSTIKSFFQQYTRKNFDENKPADEIRSENTFDFDSLQTISSSPYQKHISYSNSIHSEKAFTDYRSRYFSAGSSATSSANSTKALDNSISSLAAQALSENSNSYADENFTNLENVPKKSEVHFIGRCLGTFLLAEKDNSLFILDQHAAHERLLFDKIMNSQGASQPLLIPYKIHTESKSQDNQLEKLKSKLTQIGFETIKKEEGYWEITSIPERWTGTEYDLRTLIFVKQVEPEQIIRSIAAMTACKAAVKDGYYLDDETSAKLVEQAFTLEDPHCPHGRPIYTVFSREQLFELVKRT